jgi:hypothetical protein
MTLQARSALTGLFRYRERAGRSPREDFLSEAFCHLLNLLDEEDRTQEALRKLLGVRTLPHKKLHWQTQFVIPSGAGRASNKRPDLVGRPRDGDDAIIVVENKIAAPFTEHETADGESPLHQLNLYQEYAATYFTSSALCLLTHRTAPPADAVERQIHMVSWQTIHVALRDQFAPAGEASPAERFAQELRLFLEEHNMAEIKFGLDEIAAYPVWRGFRDKLGELGTSWQFIENHEVHEVLKSSGFAATGRYGDFDWGRCALFSGTIFTPTEGGKAAAANNSNVFVYIGVLIDSVFDCISPVMDGVPEFTAGFAVWHDGSDDYEHHQAVLQTMRDDLASAGAIWELRHTNDGSTKVSILFRSQPFLTLYEPDLDWFAQAETFYRQAIKDLRALSSKQLAAVARMGG